MTKIFITGATGYLGGDLVYALHRQHPDYDISCLVRTEEKAAQLKEAFPEVKIVLGDLENLKLVEEEASKTDVVCNFANATHEASVRAQAAGLARRTGSGSGFLIHTTGSGAMIYDDVVNGRYGKHSDKIYNDVEGLPEVLAVPDFAQARGAEFATRQAGIDSAGKVKTVIVSTASAYGAGRGLVKYRPTAIHKMVECMLERRQAVQIADGLAAWRNVHIHDLTTLYLKLVENAAAGGHDVSGAPAVWGGADGYYFAADGEHVWADLAQAVAGEAMKQCLPCSREILSIGPEQAAKLMKFGQFFWGCNSRIEARRAVEALGWRPRGPSLEEELPTIVATEARRLGYKVAMKV